MKSVCLSACLSSAPLCARPSLNLSVSLSMSMFIFTSVCFLLTIRLFVFGVIVSACLAARLFNSKHQYIPCSSSPTTLDIMLVKIGLTVDLKRPSSGAARKREKCNHQICCLSYVKGAFFCIAMSIVNLSVIREDSVFVAFLPIPSSLS